MVHSIKGKGYSQSNDIRIGADKGSLRLQFSSKLSKQFWGKTQYYKGLGRTDNPENRKWAENIARRIQSDIDHPDGLFDPTLQKYLEIKASTTVTMIPSAKAQPKLGELWEEFVEWKYRTGQIAETTYIKHFKSTYTNYLSEYLSESVNQETANKVLISLSSKTKCKIIVKKVLGNLSQMCEKAIQQDKITKNYFAGMGQDIKLPKKSQQLEEEESYIAFSREERDTIIEGFEASSKPSERHAASLVEFLFLTGCRTGEALALRWEDIKFDKDFIVFGESYDGRTKVTKCTKTDVIRIFRMKGLSRLINLLTSLYEQQDNPQPNDLIFKSVTGKRYQALSLQCVWKGHFGIRRDDREYNYPGVVTRLVNEGKIKQYLKPYATRHTFITLQANTGADLKLLADSCGTSVDMIYNHYLDKDRESTLNDI